MPSVTKQLVSHLIETRFYLPNNDINEAHDIMDMVFLDLPSDMLIECIAKNKEKLKIMSYFTSSISELSKKTGNSLETKFNQVNFI